MLTSPFLDFEIAAYSFNVSNVLVVACMYWLVDKIGPTWRLIGHIKSTLKNSLAILILCKTAYSKFSCIWKFFLFFYFRIARIREPLQELDENEFEILDTFNPDRLIPFLLSDGQFMQVGSG